jgi:hypothetical protein
MIDYERYKVNGELPLWAELFRQSERHLVRALKYDDTHNLQDIADNIANGSMQLWPAPKGAMVTQVQNYPRKRILHIYMAGGELDSLMTLGGVICQVVAKVVSKQVKWIPRSGMRSYVT